jgi:hypothetical protein
MGMARHAPTWIQDSYNMVDILPAAGIPIPHHTPGF